ncbi:ABC transporter substrate-binding protein [Patescibacteria group bacterium]
MKILLKLIFFIGLFALISFLLIYLFFQKEFESFRNEYLSEYWPAVQNETAISNKTLKIAYASNYESLDPVMFNPVTRSRILNVYESLVATDRNLQIKPGLALSWGRVHDTIWEFNLRPDVLFHDGSTFEADDIIASFNRAKNHNKSELKDLLQSIEEVEKIDDLKIRFHTKEPDPILVNRIATVLIFPSEQTKFDKPVGTAPYKYSAEQENELALERFDEYWNGLPYYKYVFIQTIENRFSRLDAIKNGDIQILANVPPTFAEELQNQGAVNVLSLPSLEVNFLMFNFNSDLFNDDRIREAISIAFDKQAFVEFSNGYATPSNQFVSNGIFGFNPDIETKEQNINEAKKVVREYDPFKRPSVSIDMVLGAEVIGEFLKLQFNEIGITTNIHYIPFEDLREKIFKKESEMYLLGWRSEIGDSAGFLENVVHSEGKFNGGAFSSKKVDQLIDLSLRNLDQEKRLSQFHEIMQIITEEEIIGVPLFETEVVYGIRIGIQFHPRLDGYILACEVTKN